MDWILFNDIALVTLEFVKVLAWPSVVLIAHCVFGRTIKTTLGRLLSFEANGYKALIANLEVKAEKIDRDLRIKSR